MKAVNWIITYELPNGDKYCIKESAKSLYAAGIQATKNHDHPNKDAVLIGIVLESPLIGEEEQELELDSLA